MVVRVEVHRLLFLKYLWELIKYFGECNFSGNWLVVEVFFLFFPGSRSAHWCHSPLTACLFFFMKFGTLTLTTSWFSWILLLHQKNVTRSDMWNVQDVGNAKSPNLGFKNADFGLYTRDFFIRCLNNTSTSVITKALITQWNPLWILQTFLIHNSCFIQTWPNSDRITFCTFFTKCFNLI